MTAVCSILAGVLYQLVLIIPPADFFTADEAYQTVFGIVPRILLGGWLAVFAGDLVNNYVLAKMKVWTRGKYLWARLIGSTMAGQAVDTTVFYVVALYGVLPNDALIQAMLLGWALKVVFETVASPLTMLVCNWLKRAEGVDHYDTDTDFTPFAFRKGLTERRDDHGLKE